MKITTCDLCGKRLSKHQSSANLKHSFGYDTSYDGTEIDIDICEECLIKIISSTKIDINSNINFPGVE